MERERASGSVRSDREKVGDKDRDRGSLKETIKEEKTIRESRQGEKKDRHREEDKREREERSYRREKDDHGSYKLNSKSTSRSPDRERKHRRRHHHHHHHQGSDASSSAGEYSSDVEEDKRAREKRERRRREESSDYERRRRRRKREEREETSQERSDRRRRKKERKHSRKEQGHRRKNHSGAIMDYGKHGVINETDITSRLTSEFRQWLVEERHINPETISRAIEKKEMNTFIEDYNTATMPSEKYYNLEAHERRMAMIRAGETVDEEDGLGGYDPMADEAAAKASFKAQRRVQESKIPTQWQSKEQLEALHRVQMERIEAAKMKQLGLQTSATKGIRMDGTEFDRR